MTYYYFSPKFLCKNDVSMNKSHLLRRMDFFIFIIFFWAIERCMFSEHLNVLF